MKINSLSKKIQFIALLILGLFFGYFFLNAVHFDLYYIESNSNYCGDFGINWYAIGGGIISFIITFFLIIKYLIKIKNNKIWIYFLLIIGVLLISYFILYYLFITNLITQRSLFIFLPGMYILLGGVLVLIFKKYFTKELLILFIFIFLLIVPYSNKEVKVYDDFRSSPHICPQ